MTDATVSRRTLAKGVAWTAPAITIAAAAPSLAASTEIEEPPVIVAAASFAEKGQGQSQVPGGWPKQGYRVQLTVAPATAPAPTLQTVTLGNGKAGTIVAGPTSLGEGLWEYVVDASASPSSLILTYTFAADGVTQTATIPARPKCGG
ncbi:MAG: hypothetical protein ACTMHL_06845 [Janibacter sp.]